jgi:radical SAM superfamily enzyme YgiQ (UPF0313 family)
MKTKFQQDWISEFSKELKRRHLGEKILWRISNRIDEFDIDYLQMLKEVGLTFVYIGIESGSNQGLKTSPLFALKAFGSAVSPLSAKF